MFCELYVEVKVTLLKLVPSFVRFKVVIMPPTAGPEDGETVVTIEYPRYNPSTSPKAN